MLRKQATSLDTRYTTRERRGIKYYEGFWVQRSMDGRNFTDIGFVKGANNSNVNRHYTYTDRTPKPGSLYYRLRQVDTDGATDFSKIVSVHLQHMALRLLAVPNPVSEEVELSWPAANEQQWEVIITDARGRTVYAKQLEIAENRGTQRVSMRHYAPGLYIVTVRQAEGVAMYRERLIRE